VAVSTADIQPSGADQTLLICDRKTQIKGAFLRAEAGDHILVSVEGFLEAAPDNSKIIGCLPKPIGYTK
jgi:hypothetical protein